MKKTGKSVTRRKFVRTLGAAGAAGAFFIGSGKKAAANAPTTSSPLQDDPDFIDQAPDGKPLKAGLVGCGGRGTGAALQFMSAGNDCVITALADVFEDRLNGTRNKLKKEKGVEVPDEKCFIGFDAYKKLIASGVDVVLLATPPHFRPEQFRTAINARKHVFMEKPVAVDPPGARSIMASAKKAEAMGLSVVTGTQRRHQREYIETYRRIKAGAIGDIVSANCYWNSGQLWYRDRKENWSDMEYMIRDWVNWCWLSGDHIVEQHVHNIDVINWFTGMHPVSAVAMGARQRRPTGDQFDMFSVDFVYENGIHVHSMCRQISGCVNNVSEHIVGTRGTSNCHNVLRDPDGAEIWKFSGPTITPYVQEHIALVTAIRTKKPINEAENTAISTMAAIMGRISAYTGKRVTWDEMMASDLKIGPTEYAMGPVDIEAVIPVPGVP